jgi:hypothetical protein
MERQEDHIGHMAEGDNVGTNEGIAVAAFGLQLTKIGLGFGDLISGHLLTRKEGVESDLLHAEVNVNESYAVALAAQSVGNEASLG